MVLVQVKHQTAAAAAAATDDNGLTHVAKQTYRNFVKSSCRLRFEIDEQLVDSKKKMQQRCVMMTHC